MKTWLAHLFLNLADLLQKELILAFLKLFHYLFCRIIIINCWIDLCKIFSTFFDDGKLGQIDSYILVEKFKILINCHLIIINLKFIPCLTTLTHLLWHSLTFSVNFLITRATAALLLKYFKNHFLKNF